MEVAVQQGSTPITQQASDQVQRLSALHPVVPVAQDEAADQADESVKETQPAAKALLVGADTRALEVHYALDDVANVWVAHILDAGTGEVVRQVPSTRVLHQLAELSHLPRVDRRA
jgi:uncharacterized FlaG/YvyC family protein